ncbi:MAG: D-alanine--D-alanine ligase [Candidatus Pacebacteria bacterium]|nr:D-alanine--D-alanine ligase [Candidatus Paceibacterota bacterium]
MFRKKITVLRGGPSSEYEVSMKTGASILDSLPEDKYDISDVAITKDNRWFLEGVEKTPVDILKKSDLVFNALHGEYGEDGKLQKLLDTFGVPYTGSKNISSALAMNKILAKKEYKKVDIKTPVHLEIEKDNFSIAEIFKTFPMPAVIKPVGLGSSVGVSIIRTGIELDKALQDVFEYSDKAMIEEYIEGKEATCGVVDNFRGEEIYTLLPVEIIPESGFFDYESKYGGGTQEICPGNFSEAEKIEIQKLAKKAHQVLGLRHYSRSDFIISPKRGIYILETNSLPGLTSESLFPKSLKAIGSNLEEFVEHLIDISD